MEVELVPALATEWSVDETNTKWTFKLREGVTWHDGERFDVNDVKATFERALNTKLLISSYGVYARTLIKDMRVVDDYTITIDTGEPNALTIPWMSNWYMQIAPEHLIRDPNPGPNDTGWRWMQPQMGDPDLGKGTGTLAIGTGPFIMTNNDPTGNMTNKRNPSYWDFDQYGNRLPYLDGIMDVFSADRNRILAMIATNDVMDVPGYTGLSKVKAERLCARRVDPCHVDLHEHGYFYVMFNDRTPPFNDPKLREVARWAIDVHKAIYVPFGGLVGAHGQWMHFAYPEANLTKQELYTLSPWLDPAQRGVLGPKDTWTQKAKDKLVELGYPQGLDLQYPWYGSNTAIFRDMKGSMSIDLRASGIRHEMTVVGAGVSNTELRAGHWNVAEASCGSPITDPTGAVAMGGLSWSSTIGGRPWAWPGVDQADALYNQANKIIDPIARSQVLKNLERYYTDVKHPFFSEGWTRQYMAIPDCIKNFVFGPGLYGSMEQTNTWLTEGYCRRAQDLQEIEPKNLNVVKTIMRNWQ